MSDHNKCPSSEKEHEKCIFRLSYFHRIQPTHYTLQTHSVQGGSYLYTPMHAWKILDNATDPQSMLLHNIFKEEREISIFGLPQWSFRIYFIIAFPACHKSVICEVGGRCDVWRVPCKWWPQVWGGAGVPWPPGLPLCSTVQLLQHPSISDIMSAALSCLCHNRSRNSSSAWYKDTGHKMMGLLLSWNKTWLTTMSVR